MVVAPLACGGSEPPTRGQHQPDSVVSTLASGDFSSDAVEALRARGRAGLAEALEAYAATDRAGDPQRWDRFVDRVAGARDAAVSGLYWELDLRAAQAEAARREVPVLSLRMLGDLRDELSCANSRFFRTVLYADPELSRWLDENFVLHWSSERPVPVVEISMGDGRKLRTTTTGNSIHYVLDAQGQVLDAVPGLYSPAGFRRALQPSLALHEQLAATPPDDRATLLRRHHAAAAEWSQGELVQLAQGVDPTVPQELVRQWASAPPADGVEPDAPSALLAQSLAMGKSRVEAPVLQRLSLRLQEERDQRIRELVKRLAETWAPSTTFSDPTLGLIRRDRPRRRTENPAEYRARIERTVAGLAGSVAEDELHNELHLRVVLHRWLADEKTSRAFETLNARVYRDLFLTPRTDPWIGLLDEEVYDGVIEAGVVARPG